MPDNDGANQNTDDEHLPDLAREPEPDDVQDETPDAEVRPPEDVEKAEPEEKESGGPVPFGQAKSKRSDIAARQRAMRDAEDGEEIEFSGDWSDPTSQVGRYAEPATGEQPEAGETPDEEMAGEEEPPPPTMRTVKINGRTVSMTEEDFEAAAMKNLAADDYLAQARAAQKEAQAFLNQARAGRESEDAPAAEPKPAAKREIDEETKKKIAEGVQYGTPDEIFSAIRTAVESISPEAQSRPDDDHVREVARQETRSEREFERANNEYEQFQADYPDLLSNENPVVSSAFQGQWVQEMQRAMQTAGFDAADIANELGTDMSRTYTAFMNMRKDPRLSVGRSVGDTLKAAAETIRPFLNGNAGTRTGSKPARNTREERARATSQPPRRATQPPQPAAPPPPTQEESRKKAMDQLKRSRGQLA